MAVDFNEAASETIVSSHITENTIWTAEGSPYILTRNIYVNATLDVDSTAVVTMGSYALLAGYPSSNHGRIRARYALFSGETSGSVISLYRAHGSSFNNCELDGVSCHVGQEASAAFQETQISAYFHDVALTVMSEHCTIEGGSISGASAYGISSWSELHIVDCDITDNGTLGIMQRNGALTLERCTISGHEYPLGLAGGGSRTFIDTDLLDNIYEVIGVLGTYSEDSNWESDWGCTFVLWAQLIIQNGSTLTISDGAIVDMDGNQFHCGTGNHSGNLVANEINFANGYLSFGSGTDNSITNCNMLGVSIYPSPRNGVFENNYIDATGYDIGVYIYCGDVDAVTIANTEVRNASYYGFKIVDRSNGNSEILVDGCTIRDNGIAGIYVMEGCVAVANSIIDGQNHAILIDGISCVSSVSRCDLTGLNSGISESNTPVHAGGNYWGHSTGPAHPSNPAGLGALVTDNVDFTPFSTVPINSSIMGALEGTVTVSGSGLPIVGARVVTYPQMYSGAVISDELGFWRMDLPAGTGYTVVACKEGYTEGRVENVEVFEDENTQVDIFLDTVVYDEYRVRPFNRFSELAVLSIPEGCKGYAWYTLEGKADGQWSSVNIGTVISDFDSGRIFSSQVGLVQYEYLDDVYYVDESGVFCVEIDWRQVGDGMPGSQDTLTPIRLSYPYHEFTSGNSCELNVEIVPYQYRQRWGSIEGIRLGAHVEVLSDLVPFLSVSGWLGGEAGQIMESIVVASGGMNTIDRIEIQRRNDFIAGTKVRVGLPALFFVDLPHAEVGIETSITSTDAYRFNSTEMSALDCLLAVYLYNDEGLIGDVVSEDGPLFAAFLVYTLIHNHSEIDQRWYSDQLGRESIRWGEQLLGVRWQGAGDYHNAAAIVEPLHEEHAFGWSTRMDENDQVTNSVYYFSNSVNDSGLKHLFGANAISVRNLLPSRMRGIDGTYNPVNRGFRTTVEDEGIDVEYNFGTFYELDDMLSPLNTHNLDGLHQGYEVEISLDPANGAIPSNIAPELHFGEGSVDLGIVNSETFRSDFVGVLEWVYEKQDVEPNYPADYVVLAKDINTESYDFHGGLLGINFGVDGEEINESIHQVAEGYWYKGTPYLKTELIVRPSIELTAEELIDEWWTIARAELWTQLLEAVDAIRVNWPFSIDKIADGDTEKRGRADYILSDLGSRISIPDGAIPADVDTAGCMFWTWDERNSHKKMEGSPGEEYWEYMSMVRSIRQEIAGMGYGVGGFYKLYPAGTVLNQSAFLRIVYAEEELEGVEDESLSIFGQDSTGAWLPVESAANADSNFVEAEIDRFLTYTVAPRMAQGQYELLPDVAELVADGVSTTTLTSEPLLRNDGQPVEDGTLFTATATDGTILTADADISIAGIQIPVAGQVVEMTYQAGLLPVDVTLRAESLTGYARCEATLQLLDADIPTAPVITSLTPQWRGFTVEWDSGGDADVAGYLVWYDTDEPDAPYDGSSTVWGEDSPISVGMLDSLVVDELEVGTTYYVAITALDMVGNQSPYSEEFTVSVVGVEDETPRVLGLQQNFPNPFNPQTKIQYSLPHAGRVSLKIFDVRGRLVRTLVDGEMPVGRHEAIWQARDNAGRGVASGVYIYVLQAPDEVKTRKMCVIK